MQVHHQPAPHHSRGIAHACLIVQNELLRKQMQDLAVRGKAHRTCFFDSGADIVTRNIARTRPQRNAATTGDALDMRSRHRDHGITDRTFADLFRFLHRFLYALHRLVQFDDDAFA